MLCTRCEGRTRECGTPRQPAGKAGVSACERCGGAILTLKGVAVGVGDATLAQLARFGLASTGEPLLELKREGD